MNVEVTGIPEGDTAVADFVIAAGRGTRKFIIVVRPHERPLCINIITGDERDLEAIEELGHRARVLPKVT